MSMNIHGAGFCVAGVLRSEREARSTAQDSTLNSDDINTSLVTWCEKQEHFRMTD